MAPEQIRKKLEQVVKHRNCSGCGACVVYSNGTSGMIRTKKGPIPELNDVTFSEEALKVCPGIGINYPELYDFHYGGQPSSYLHGVIKKVRIGHSGTDELRQKGASGGIITSVLLYLLNTGKVDGVVCVKQGIPSPREASAIIASSEEELKNAMQSVYIPVSVLDILTVFKPGRTYAMVCLPEQAAALRKMQQMKHPAALQVKYVLGPYTGTALYPAAIDAFLRMKRVQRDDAIVSLKWREGEWPGYLEIKTESGRVLQSKKIYYNFLIPFFITHTSLRSMDFVNEFTDLSVGDAWSPKYEAERKGFAVFVSRTDEMETIVNVLIRSGKITAEEFPNRESVAMHGHMLDFKKRGGYLRNRMRGFFGHPVPDYGYRPAHVTLTRKMTEIFISSVFLIAGTRVARFLLTLLPEKIMGAFFDFMRLKWKNISKPSKRKGLAEYNIKRT